jgi:hypothetical protein
VGKLAYWQGCIKAIVEDACDARQTWVEWNMGHRMLFWVDILKVIEAGRKSKWR